MPPAQIRSLFSTARRIDRPIEKVIDYYAADEDRLLAEVEEYEITDNVEDCFRRFLDVYDEGVRNGRVTEIGVWVSGFYGSGKSSFTKYLGFSLDKNRTIKGRPFMDYLCDRFKNPAIPAHLKALSAQYPAAVVLLDLATDTLVGNPRPPVSEVLYWKVLQWAGYSTREKKLAHLAFTLERVQKYDDFKNKYRQAYGEDWGRIQNDPVLGVKRASEILPQVWPEEFKDEAQFRSLRFNDNRTTRELAQDMVDLCRRKTGLKNIIFLVDEAGQYVAPNGQFILDFDGLSRCLKEIGKGQVWLLATGQQTLAEIVERAAYNSAELNRMKDRFPIGIHLDARDIREITYRRLLTKSGDGEKKIKDGFSTKGESLCTYTRLEGSRLFRGDPDAETFAKLYPFLPQHFDILLELIRTLASSTGGLGLRSAIRVIQDVLVDASRTLPAGASRLADKEIGCLASVDNFYDTLRADIAKKFTHIPEGVDKVLKAFPDKPLYHRIAKAIAALQPLETFPRTAENIAALLYPALGAPAMTGDVATALREIVAAKECGVIEDPQAGGYVFLSDKSKDERERRNSYVPTLAECRRIQVDLLRDGVRDCPLFSVQPSARLEHTKDVGANVRLDRATVISGDEAIDIRIEFVDPARWDQRRTELLTETNSKPELKNAVVLLARTQSAVDDLLPEIARSQKYLGEKSEIDADHDVGQYIRSERTGAERNKERAAKLMQEALVNGTFVFRGVPKPAKEHGETLDAAVRGALADAAKAVFSQYGLAPIRPKTDLASKFLAVERLQRVNRETDPLSLVVSAGGQYKVDTSKPVLAEVLRVFDEKVRDAGTGRLQGNAVQDLFAAPPYGWTKDTVRYLFAALLRASPGEVEFYIPGVEGAVRTAVQQAEEAVKSTVSFNRIGIARRGEKVPIEALDRAARRLEELFGEEVLPEEESISKAVRKRFPAVLEEIGSLPDRLRLLGLKGTERASRVAADSADLIKGDASGAAVVLGAAACKIPDDIRWARAAAKALNDGGDRDIQGAKAATQDVEQLGRLFPQTAEAVLPAESKTLLSDILDSENWYERLVDLRGQVRGLLDRTAAVYADEYAAYGSSLKDVAKALEAEQNWPLLPEDERDAALDQLNPAVPEKPDAGSPVRSLNTLTTATSMVPGLRDRLLRKVRSWRPPESETPPPEDGEETVPAAEILTKAVISTEGELDGWLSSVRTRIVGVLRKGKKAVIR
jgi:hypothetical protein